MKNNKFFIANWKMNLSFEETINYITTNYDNLVDLPKKSNSNIILCPSFTELYPVTQILKDTEINTCAQNCSANLRGSFTGDVSVVSLNDIGCEYCIIGHSECRKTYKETNNIIIQKAENLIDYGINPIICIGEEKNDHQNNKTISVLEKQLNPILDKIMSIPNIGEYLEIFLAYEPVWSIGTGQVADIEHLQTVFAWLKKLTLETSEKINWKLIYGGSINSNNITTLKKIDEIDGFLIGAASTNFQEFEKIVNSGILEK